MIILKPHKGKRFKKMIYFVFTIEDDAYFEYIMFTVSVSNMTFD